MSEIRPITLLAEMRTGFEVEDDGCLAITQEDADGHTVIVELSPRQSAILVEYLTANIEAMHSKAAVYGGQ